MSEKKTLQEYAPHLVTEWSDKNGVLTPMDVTIGSHKKVWWKGSCGHEWEAEVKNRVGRKSRCPYCSGNTLLPGFNDAATAAPWLEEEWSDRNGELRLSDMAKRSNKKVWWKCDRGHEWQVRVADRVGKHARCPYCTNERVERGINDITALMPELAKEMVEDHFGTNGPEVHTVNSHKMVRWRCKDCGYEWDAQIYTRERGGAGCPKCRRKRLDEALREKYRQNRLKIDFIRDLPKAALEYYLDNAREPYSYENTDIIGIPLQFYLPERKGAIIVADPLPSKVQQKATAAACRKAGIKLLYIVPNGERIYNNCHCITMTEDSPEVWSQAVQAAMDLFEISVESDIRRDREGIFRLYAIKRRGI